MSDPTNPENPEATPSAIFSVRLRIRSHTYVLSAEALALFKDQACIIEIDDITESTFLVGHSSNKIGQGSDAKTFMRHSAPALSRFLMCLNVGTLGHFEWESKAPPHPHFLMFDHGEKKVSSIRYPSSYFIEGYEPTPLTAGMVLRAAQVFIGMCREDKLHVLTEYLKGVYHLGLNFYDLSFEKEAFANFYRSFEYFITNRHLKQRGLINEYKQISKFLIETGAPDTIMEMFKELYILRGEQVMHAQKEQRPITWEDAFKMKLLADHAIQSHYRPFWENPSFNPPGNPGN